MWISLSFISHTLLHNYYKFNILCASQFGPVSHIFLTCLLELAIVTLNYEGRLSSSLSCQHPVCCGWEGEAEPVRVLMSSLHPSWPLTPLPQTSIFALIMHLHIRRLRHALSVEKCTHTPKLPPLQLSSHLPIRQWKLADCDPSATLFLNCSPSACRNERQPVYSGYTFSLPPQHSLYFPYGKREFNDVVLHLSGKRNEDL